MEPSSQDAPQATRPGDGSTFPDSGTESFLLRGDALWCEDVPVAELAARHGTPLYVYSATAMRQRFARLRAAFGAEATICYAVKANPTLAVLRLFGELGAGFDVVSAGELLRVQAAGLPLDRVVFAGAGKRPDELAMGVELGVGAFHVESMHEIEPLAAAAQAHGREVAVALRLNPDVAADTHAYIATGRGGDKFGLGFRLAAEAVARIRAAKGLRLVGYHVHLGSQLRDPQVWRRALDRVVAWMDEDPARREGVESYDLGGGFGIGYGEAAGLCDVEAVAAAVREPLEAYGLRPVLEPGRFLVGDAGVLVTEVLGEKLAGDRRLVLVDAAMNDLLRPSLYGARHPIRPLRGPGRTATTEADVVGPVCESGDFLGRGVPLPSLADGEYLAVLAAGAYGASMASNYNSRPRPAEVMVDGADVRLIRRREAPSDLWRLES